MGVIMLVMVQPGLYWIKNNFIFGGHCNDCYYNILAAPRYVRKTYDWGIYEMILSPAVRKCTCNAKYEYEIAIEENNVMALEERLKRNISIAEENLNNYFNFSF